MSKKQYMRERYNATAPGYDELYRDEQLEKYAAVLNILVRAADARLCDVGSGTSLLLEHLHRLGLLPQHYIGVDLSEGMLAEAKGRIRRLGLGHIADLIQGDAEHLPLRNDSCGIATSFTVIDLVEDQARMLAELDRISGCIIVSSLKKAHMGKRSLPRYGAMIASTSKDIIFLRGCASQP